jgi:4-hydroxy-2-oxoheptanedioate aldolase
MSQSRTPAGKPTATRRAFIKTGLALPITLGMAGSTVLAGQAGPDATHAPPPTPRAAGKRFRAVLARGEVALGTCAYSFSPAVIETAGYCGLDFCRIDNEHAWRQDHTAEAMVRGALLSGIAPLMRVDRDNPYLIRKALEAGAAGVIVPHVHDAEEVKGMVEAAKFPPRGKRGYGGISLSGQWGVAAGTDWMQWSDAESMVIPMIEDIAVMPQIRAIMRVDGLDGVFFGPADFSISAGVPLQTRSPAVLAALRETILAANEFGRFVIFGAAFPYWDDLDYVCGLGVHAIEIGHDLSILAAVWKKTLAAGRGRKVGQP